MEEGVLNLEVVLEEKPQLYQISARLPPTAGYEKMAESMDLQQKYLTQIPNSFLPFGGPEKAT
jgi:hypothetical protein